MAGKGPRPTPKAVLLLRESWRGKRTPNDPKETPGAPGMPELCEQAAAVWVQVVPMLLETKVLATIDGATLGRYCQLRVLWDEAIREQPQSIRKVLDVSTQLLKYEAEFGMTPASRSRVKVPDKPKNDGNDKKRFFA